MASTKRTVVIAILSMAIMYLVMKLITKQKTTDSSSVVDNTPVSPPVVTPPPTPPPPPPAPTPPPPPPRPVCQGGQIYEPGSNSCVCPDRKQAGVNCDCPGVNGRSGIGMLKDPNTKQCVCPTNAQWSGEFCYCPAGFKISNGHCCSAGRDGMPSTDGQTYNPVTKQCECSPGMNFSGGVLPDGSGFCY